MVAPLVLLALQGCGDDPLDGPIGGLVFTIETAPRTCDGSVEAADGEVLVCHAPAGRPEHAHTIAVGESAVDTHLAHGDTLGACDSGCSDPVADIESIMVHPQEVQVVYSETVDGSEHRVVVDTAPDEIPACQDE